MKVFSVILAGFFIIWATFTCMSVSDRPAVKNNQPATTVVARAAADGLDLQAVAELAKNAKDAEDLEKKLNKEGGVNNLDLNDDDKIDFIKVTEYGSKDAYGFSLTTEPVAGEDQELATIEFERNGEQVDMQVSGNRQVYGSAHHYHSSFGIGDALILGYLMSNHRPYYSPYRYGSYPSYYGSYRPRSYNKYKSWTSGYKKTKFTRLSTSRPTRLSSPNANKVASSGIKSKLANPTAAQKTFASRNPSRAVKSGGFGRKSATSSRSSSSSTRSSARSRSSSRGFGGRGK